jgi:hypothetical protein
MIMTYFVRSGAILTDQKIVQQTVERTHHSVIGHFKHELPRLVFVFDNVASSQGIASA